jgi:hypothetical protein
VPDQPQTDQREEESGLMAGATKPTLRRGFKILIPITAAVWLFSSSQPPAQDSNSQLYPQETWGVVTACYLPAQDRKGKNSAVAVGFAIAGIEELAKAASLKDAREDMDSDAGWKCDWARVFTKGCAYVVRGCNEKAKHCAWALGVTEKEVLKKVQGLGYKVDAAAVKGGCI